MRSSVPGEFTIVSLYDSETESFTQEFFLPDEGFISKQVRLAELKTQGYRVAGVLYVNRETFYNAKLACLVNEYIKEDHTKQDAIRENKYGNIDADALFIIVQDCEDAKWRILKSMTKLIRRMMRWGYDIENEIALQLYDQYMANTV